MSVEVSLETTIARIADLHALRAGPTAATAPGATAGGTSFDAALRQASGTSATAPVGAAGGDAASRMVALAQAEVGQAEQPPGSNDSPRIADYRKATQGGGVGPWCAYFTSWAAKEAGVPVGEAGQGFGSVDALYAWAQRTGRAFAAGSKPPQAGDLIVWDEHIGIVEKVLPNGQVQTIEGNSSDRVSRRTHAASDALGYVRLG